MTRIAFFDMDGTITRHSADRQLIRWMVRKKILGTGRLVVSVLSFIVRHPIAIFQTGFKTNKLYLAGLAESTVAECARECFDAVIRADIRPSVRDEISKKKTEGYRIVILSGALETLVRWMAREVGADDAIASRIGVANGRYTGQLTDLHPYGKRKAILAERYCLAQQSDLSEAVAYGNEGADLFLLSRVREAVAVTPDGDLHHWARHYGWRMMEG